jgi:hypothetical protein
MNGFSDWLAMVGVILSALELNLRGFEFYF